VADTVSREALEPLSSQERVHRFALSISGGVSLGAYEAGVLTQLYRDLYVFNAQMKGRARVSIDAVAGASAGSITGLILAQALALGSPPDLLEARMRTCWVDLLDIHGLLAPSAQPDAWAGAVFTDGVVDKIIDQALDMAPGMPETPQETVALWMTMTNLDGVPYVIDFERKDEDHVQVTTQLYALDYKDYVSFLLEGNQATQPELRLLPADGVSDPLGWRLAADAARASSAFPVAFAARYQKRNLDAYKGYQGFRAALKAGLETKAADPALHPMHELPSEVTMQFVDGGLFDNEPIGKAIDAVACLNARDPRRNPARIDLNGGKTERSFLMIEPEPELPAAIAAALSAPTLASPLLPPALFGKILSAYFNQALYGDFLSAQKINTALVAMHKALARLDTLNLAPEVVANLKKEILNAAGLAGKEIVTLQRIPQAPQLERRLASAFAGHFGGFFRRDYRAADFLVGKHEARLWLSKWLAEWLHSHSEDVGLTGKTRPEIELFVAAQLGEAPSIENTRFNTNGDPDPNGLTAAQLADSGWFPIPEATPDQKRAALTEDERSAILSEAQKRLMQIVGEWLHPNLLTKTVIDKGLDWSLALKFLDPREEDD
jgi:hypothetical protein